MQYSSTPQDGLGSPTPEPTTAATASPDTASSDAPSSVPVPKPTASAEAPSSGRPGKKTTLSKDDGGDSTPKDDNVKRHANGRPFTSYELEREENMARIQRMIDEMGLRNGASQIVGTVPTVEKEKRTRKRKQKGAEAPVRKSRRLLGVDDNVE